MFVNKTVIVLGAGASWHYGYPTGEELVDKVVTMAGRFRDHCHARLKCGQTVQVLPIYVEKRIDRSTGLRGGQIAWKAVADECQLLIDRLKNVRPIVIDYFLGWNPSLQEIGRLMIAAVILECEAQYRKLAANQNRILAFTNSPIKSTAEEIRRIDITKYKDDWYRFLTHKLVIDCAKSADLIQNNDVQFVTFNYDASLEYHLYRSLTSLDMLHESDVRAFLKKDRFIHVYGSVHDHIPSEKDFVDAHVAETLGGTLSPQLNFETDFGPRKAFIDRCLEAADNLKTIDPHEKDKSTTLDRAKKWILDANVVYILGYGFDTNNNRRIGLDKALQPKARIDKAVMFTNYRDINTVNKRASKLMFNRYDQFLGLSVHGLPRKGGYAEKSDRDVYEALELDFDALESELMPTTEI